MKYIVTADIHLRTTTPLCRTDDWDSFQAQRFKDIYGVAKEHKVGGVIIVGDLFDNPNISEKLLHLVLTTINEFGILTVFMPGNHDVPYHALQHIENTKVALLQYHPLVEFLIPDNDWSCSYNNIRLIHQLTFKDDKDLPPDVKAHIADDWLNKYDEDLIICGDMHKAFNVRSGGRLLINCGHTNCQKVSERFDSGVWCVDTDGHCEYILFNSDLNNVGTDHIEEKMEKDNRFEKLVFCIGNDNSYKELDFMANVKCRCDKINNGNDIYSLISDCTRS